MDRRQFIKFSSLITVSVATGGLAGCNDSSSSNSSPSQVFTPFPLATGTNWKFPQSVASGDPKPDSILLWTRVVPATADDVTSVAASDFSIRLVVTDVDNSAALGTDTLLAGSLVLDTNLQVKAEFDHSVRNKVTGLASGKTYFYQFLAGDVRSKVGRFKTAPAKETDLAQLKILFTACQDWSVNHWGAFNHIARNESFDVWMHLGDYIYETVGEAFQSGAVEALHPKLTLPDGVFKSGTSGAKYANTLADYRYLYKRYRTDARLQAMHERFAIVAVWDDHEFSDDCWRDAETYGDGTISAAGGDNTRQPERRRSANQAWFEFMPADITFTPTASGIETVQIYRDLQFGKLAHLVMTDQRLYRADHMIPEASVNPATGKVLGSIGSRYMVPEGLLYGAEAQKIAAATAGGIDPLTPVSLLSKTQRDWWKERMQNSSATWKLWGNEVSLLRMGIDGTDAIATLLALNSISTVATNIGNAAALTGGNVPAAGALVAIKTSGGSDALAGAVVQTLLQADKSGTAGPEELSKALSGVTGLSATQAGVALQAYIVVRPTPNPFGGTPAPVNASAQAAASAQIIAFGLIKPDIQAKKDKSAFVIASGQAAALAPFFSRFILNADQWDGYNAERKDLMAFLRDKSIKNVVALTGDIHAFYAGTVSDDYSAANGGKAVMVDLVTAGISSDSFFTYLSSAVSSLSASLSSLVFYPLAIPVPGVGNVQVNFNLLDYTLGKATGAGISLTTLEAHTNTFGVVALSEQLRVQLRGALAAKGVPEAQLDATTSAVLSGLIQNADFNTNLGGLVSQLASLRSNPWLALSNTDAQGYALVTVTPQKLTCEFKQVNRLVGSAAPTTVVARTTTATVNKDVAAVSISN